MAVLSQPKRFPARTNEIDAAIALSGLKKFEVADRLGIQHTAFSLMKAGVRAFPPELIVPLADILGISPDQVRDLFGLGYDSSTSPSQNQS